MNSDNFVQIFIEEALELLGSLEDKLLELEENPESADLISAVFRVMHTIKGSAGMVGLSNISTFTHKVETILDDVRAGKIKVNKGFIDYTLKSRDIILDMIRDSDYVFEDQDTFFQDFLTSLNVSELDVASISTKEKVHEKVEEEIVNSNPVMYRILFKPEKDIYSTGTNPLMMVNEVLELGEGIVIPNYNQIPGINDLKPEECHISWEIFVSTTKTANDIHDIFIFVEDKSDIKIEEYEVEIDSDTPERLGELLVKRGTIKAEELQEVLGAQKKIGEILVNENIVSSHEVKSALKAQEYINKSKTKSKAKEKSVTESIRVSSEKLDSLIDLVGEIVTIYAQMLQMSHDSKDSNLISIIERFGLLTEELRDNAMGMRMLPIGSTFSRFRRLVRDLSSELGKKIEIITEGAETELDKNVIEQLNDPLVHIIRNCIDHGIESPQERKDVGKSEKGVIKLSAIHSGASVHISIEDNGGGLSRSKIKEKAISKGIMHSGDDISDDELLNLIFSPGFSTASSVTSVSGRGVGLDVVKKQIEQLKGSVHVESEEGQYTKFTLVLPITLAIIEGLLVSIGDDYFVLPLSGVEACVELKEEDKLLNPDKNVITFRNKMVPFIDLREFFSIKTEREKIEQIVVVNSNSGQVGILVDHVIGGNQTVIKSLGSMYSHIKEISGAAILGNGSVALVFDIEKLVRIVEDFEEIVSG